MKQIEILLISIRSNLILAKYNLKKNNPNLAMRQIQDARYSLEKLKILTEKNET